MPHPTPPPLLGRTLPTRWQSRCDAAWRLMRADRPIGWLLLLWPTLMALWLAAGGQPPIGVLLVFVAGVWLTRAAGCVINDYADRWLDGRVERTRSRPLVAGELSGRFALGLFVLLMLMAFGLVLTTNARTVGLSVLALILATSYPYLKRHTHLAQVGLGVAFGMGIPMAWTAVTDAWPPPTAWLLFCANLLWTVGYDTWYAMVDRDDDLRAGSHSTALLFGDLDLFALAVLYGGFLAAMALLAGRAGLGVVYWVGWLLAAGLVAQLFWRGRSRNREDCFAAFRANPWVGFVLFLGIAFDQLA